LAQRVEFEKEVAAHAKVIEARVRAAQENEATSAEAYKIILDAHRCKTDQIVKQARSKVNKVASMTPDMRGVVEALAAAVQNFEQGMSKVAGATSV
jgi:ATP phosphoribosyltransferase regulatory subunit HisZ